METPNEQQSFAQHLRVSRGLLGAWCTFASFAEYRSHDRTGIRFLVLDMQHCELTQSQFPTLLGAFRAAAPTPVIRVPQDEYHIINWLLDQGAPALLMPMVNSPEAARAAVEAAKFPPLGKRSFGPSRAARYSF